MQLKNVQFALNLFAKNVIKFSKNNLTRQKKAGGALYKSLDYFVKGEPDRIFVQFYMTDYGMFVDQGVRGAKSSTRNRTSPFRFGTGTGKKGGLRDGILEWLKRKRFQFQDDAGRFMSYQSMSFIISRAIYNKGIKPSLFFTRPFEKAFNNLSEEIKKQFELDLQEFLPNKVD